MRKKIITIFLLSLCLCSCGKDFEDTVGSEKQQKRNILENTEEVEAKDSAAEEETDGTEEIAEIEESAEDTRLNENEETEESSASASAQFDSSMTEDKSKIKREEWIAKALQEEESRRVMPELAGEEDIIAYIAETGGKVYKGTYEGDTYWMYLTADCNYAGQYTPYVTVIKEKDTGKNPESFGGLENLYGLVRDETEKVFDAKTIYKFGYNGSDFDRTIGDFIESDGLNGGNGMRVFFNSGTDVVYTFWEENQEWQDGDSIDEMNLIREIQFTLAEPEEAKYFYSQEALNGNWNDFMVYDGYHDYYVRVEFTDGQNMMDKNSHYYMTVLSSVEDLDTFNEKKYQIMAQYYSYNEFSRLEDDEFMLEFISDRQAVLTNKQTGTSALVKYHKGYLTEMESMSDSPYYFYDNRIVESNAYGLAGKDYTAEDGTVISFSAGGGSWVDYEDKKDVGERVVDVYLGEHPSLTAPVQVVDGKTLRVTETSTNTDLLFVWSDDNHFVVRGTGQYLSDLDGMNFSYEEHQLYGY